MYFVDVDFWQNIELESRPGVEKIVGLLLNRTPHAPDITIMNWNITFMNITLFKTPEGVVVGDHPYV